MVIKKFHKLRAMHQIIVAILVGFAVISFWRGIWGLLDIYLFPGNYVLRMWTATILGLAILIATHYTIKELT